jgi:radical SAM-linked protein
VPVTLQRLRIWYRKTEAAAELQPGQLGRVWFDAFDGAGMHPARPEGSRRARLELGPALPAGATGECEPLDVWLVDGVDTDELCARLHQHLPPGLEAVAVEEIGEWLPSLGSSLRSATYEVVLPREAGTAEAIGARCRELMSLDTLPWTEVRGERVREVDLRAQVIALDARGGPDGVVLTMRLVLEQERMGRPASVVAALGIAEAPVILVRTAVEVARPLVALRAWRAHGRFA